ncbi:acyltransferase family protein [Oceanicaulis alexandrii]|uniref:acyltransferase family protein n=1 Tax=Oceanicaulis alexandrii TaxID=153233 RepID=UPI0035CFAB00
MLKYRPEIDGLRTIAVLSVVFYHAELFIGDRQLFRGGFLGVDVFFVISGYLITSIILKEAAGTGFSFLRFYERRARRLLPALIVVLLAATLAAVPMLHASALKEYAGSAVTSLLFSSNIWFWLQDAYTAEPSRLKPLLHTWTLSVEEQFYIFIPVLVLLVLKIRQSVLLPTLVLVFLSSLILAQISSQHATEANFYLLPMRAWELMAGAILACLEVRYGRKSPPVLQSVMPVLGVCLVCGPILVFHHGLPHPSYLTLAPVLGVALLIWFTQPGGLVTTLLSLRPMVWIGLVSYSLYLWHFPMFALARVQFGELSLSLTLGLIAGSVVLSGLSYVWIEKPFRNAQQVSLPRFMALASLLVGLLLIINGTIFILDGRVKLPGGSHFAYTQAQIESGRNARFDRVRQRCLRLGWEVCDDPQNGRRNIMIVGDSHTVDALNVLDVIFPQTHLMQSTLPGCPPSPDIRALVSATHPQLPDCEAMNRERFDPASLQDVDMVVITYLGDWYGPDDLEPYLQFLTANTDVPILWFGNYIHLNADFPDLLRQGDGLESVESLGSQIRSRFLYEDQNTQLAASYGVVYVSKRDALCDGDDCPLFAEGEPFTWDRHHLSRPFARRLGEALEEDLRPLLSPET